MPSGLNVAVVGATGLVGQTILAVLEERRFPIARLTPIASDRSSGRSVSFLGHDHRVVAPGEVDFTGIDIALCSAGRSVSERLAPQAAAAGCVVIDNTSCFRYDDDVPLVVPEVNPAALADFRSRRIVANPNCSTIQLVVALKPIYDAVGIDRLNVATYQSVSGAGSSAVEELRSQTSNFVNGGAGLDTQEPPLAFNVIPRIDVFEQNGYTREEMKIVWETRKIFGDAELRVNATAARVPVFCGHSVAVHLETRKKIKAEEARDVLRVAPGVRVCAELDQYPTAVTHGAGQDAVWVGRIREDISHERGLNLWIVADNVRKGAALNSVQVAEILVKNYL